MSDEWKSIYRKIDEAPSEGPSIADWEKMSRMIDAREELNSSKRGGGLWWKTSIGILAVALFGFLLSMYFEGNPETQKFLPQDEPQDISDESPGKSEFDMDKHDIESVTIGKQTISSDEKNRIIAPVADKEKPSYNPDNKNIGTVKDSSSLRVEDSKPVVVGIKEEENRDILGNHRLVNRTGAGNLVNQKANFPHKSILKPEFKPEPVAKRKSMDMVLKDLRDDMLRSESENTFQLRSPAPPSDIKLRNRDIRITGIGVGSGYLTDFSKNLNGFGSGAELYLQRKNLALSIGVYYYTLSNEDVRSYDVIDFRTDTIIDTNIITNTVEYIDSAWVVLGPNQGGYVYDTVKTVSTDTTYIVTTDSVKTVTQKQEKRKIQVSYIELPILLGRNFRFNKFNLELYGGVSIHKLTAIVGQESEVHQSFGMDLMFRPGVRYYMLPNISLNGRIGARYGIWSEAFRAGKVYADLQFGISYYW